jgi:hypothetical protein
MLENIAGLLACLCVSDLTLLNRFLHRWLDSCGSTSRQLWKLRREV